jgi:putative SbcD/Mre11-related phosphoesterase
LNEMDRSRLEIDPGVWLDARGAIWLETERVLAATDLHLGYAWAHRYEGNLLPLRVPDDTTARLSALIEHYAPRDLVLLGDVVHSTVPLPALREELCVLFEQLSKKTTLRLVIGNHDAQLAKLLQACGIEAAVMREFSAGPHLLVHGDGDDDRLARKQLAAAKAHRGRVIIGHEHPAVHISDGVATGAKCPCFVCSSRLVILPAFSPWAAGTNIRAHNFMSSLARQFPMERAVAIAAGKLLPLKI